MEGLKILFASPEVLPFVKTGGLADVSGMLPRVLAGMGHTVKVALPKYSVIPHDKLNGCATDVSFDLDLDGATEPVVLNRLIDHASPLEYFFIENDHFFDRPALYVDPITGQDFPDNHLRFVFFCRGLLELLKRINWQPDIIHANDWQTALLPTYLATLYKNDPFFAHARTVFTIHNMAYQGQFPAKTFDSLGVADDLFYAAGPFEFYGSVNFMKSAIVYATVINTVSERYALEIQSSAEYGAGLEGVLRNRSHDLYGIVNGVDYSDWSPSRDKLIPFKFTPSNLSGKGKNKIELASRLGLPFREKAPLVGMITRLADQKGLDLIAAAASDIFALDLQMIVLGTGDRRYHELFIQLQTDYPDKLRVLLTYDNEMAHWIEAGADAFLMPSRYEPCGLNQLYSLKYGTLPIVRATGGLADTIIDIDAATGTGTGFVFEAYDPEEMIGAIRRAVDLFQHKRLWRQIMKQAMKQDFSWENSARRYVDLYRKAINKP